MLMLVSLSISDNLLISEQKPSLATYKSQKMNQPAKDNHLSSKQEKKLKEKFIKFTPESPKLEKFASSPENATKSHQFCIELIQKKTDQNHKFIKNQSTLYHKIKRMHDI